MTVTIDQSNSFELEKIQWTGEKLTKKKYQIVILCKKKHGNWGGLGSVASE